MTFKLLSDLKFISSKLGNDPLLIQGPGGNSSLKIGDEMFIKASGKWLADAEKNDIFVKVFWKKINENINLKKINPLKDTAIGNSNLRPSIETTLHALMPHKFVFHTHPIELLSLLVQKDAKNILKKLLHDLKWTWVDYTCPGIDLAIKSKCALEQQSSNILILANHGLVVGSETYEEILSLTQELCNRFKQPKRSFSISYDRKIADYEKKINMKFASNQVIHTLALDEISYKYCNIKSTILYPDQAVFLGPKLNCINQKNNPNYDFNKNPFDYVIIYNIGVFINNDAKPEIETMLKCHSEVLLRVPLKKELAYLSSNQVASLVGWEAEIYRQNLKRY